MSVRDDTSRHKGIGHGEKSYGRIAIAVIVVAGVLGGLYFLQRETQTGWFLLREVRATSDEGFLYLLLKTDGKGAPDWNRVLYRVAIDTYDRDRGERMLPKPYEASIGTGAEFMIELGGPDSSFLRVTPSYDPYPLKGRTEEGGWIVSPKKSTGKFVPLMFEANRERFSRDGNRYAARYLDRGKLIFAGPGHDAKTDMSVSVAVGSQGAIELRIPWALLNVSDPSSRRVLNGESRSEESETTETDGFRFYAYSFDKKKKKDPLADRLPGVGRTAALYAWQRWDQPKYTLELKESAKAIAATMKELGPLR